MNRRRVQRLAHLEGRAIARAQDAAALAAERVRSLTDAELTALIAYADGRPDLEYLTPTNFCDALGWSPERAIAFMSRKK